ncbi:MAG: TIGR03619 family F420-dependent LLM class oxidoreductase [Acidimicrobiia bacterium]
MRFGIALPQYGPATAEGLTRAARQAEDLGFADVWVGDHIAVPDGVPYPPSFLLESLATLSFAAAVTGRVGLGTSVLILPLRKPLVMAKQLATIDVLSGGRLLLGIGAGWLEGEFDASGVPFRHRGDLTDEAIDVLRTCWAAAPTSFEGPTVRFTDMKVKPLPGRQIPLWVGGTGERALRRAVEKGDGWQGAFLPLEEVARVTKRLRAERPEQEFTLSVRVDVDGLAGDLDELRRQLDAYAAAGVTHVLSAPTQRDLDPWLASVEALWRTFEEYR